MNTYYIAGIPFSDELYHHGIKGQKWGIRRYQNPDGTLTAAGKERYVEDGAEHKHNKPVESRLAIAGRMIKDKIGRKQKQNFDQKNSINMEISRERGKELAAKGKQ